MSSHCWDRRGCRPPIWAYCIGLGAWGAGSRRGAPRQELSGSGRAARCRPSARVFADRLRARIPVEARCFA
eukprot:594398-Pyramimonas_sp.AAC.1